MVFRVLCACGLMAYSIFAVAQAQMTERERAQAISEVVALNEAMVEALARGDVLVLERVMAPDARVNGPNNKVATGEQILERFRKGELDHNLYERKIEDAYVNGDIVVLMGEEIVVAQGTNQSHVGEKVRRRFTSVWRRNNGQWQQIARQATNIGTAP